MGSGVCVLDYDNDGWQDILFVNSMDWPGHGISQVFPALYHNNRDGTFTDVTRQAGLAVEMYGMGCAVGDYDNDGNDDIYITASDRNHLFHNLGNGHFADVTAQSWRADRIFQRRRLVRLRQRRQARPVRRALCGLVDCEGSILLPRHKKQILLHARKLYKGESCEALSQPGQRNLRRCNEAAPGSTMRPASRSALRCWIMTTMAGSICLSPTTPSRTSSTATITTAPSPTLALQAGVAYSDAGAARAGMGADNGDYDNSGHPGLVIGNFTNEGMALYHNDGSGLFTAEARGHGHRPRSRKSLTFSTFFFDYDLDGLPDVLAVNGHVADDISVVAANHQVCGAALLFRNRGNGNSKMSRQVGPCAAAANRGPGRRLRRLRQRRRSGPGDHRTMARALLRNDNGNQNDMLRVKTVGTRSNRDGIGAKITVKTSEEHAALRHGEDRFQLFVAKRVAGDLRLGQARQGKTVSLEIVWPSGRKDTFPTSSPINSSPCRKARASSRHNRSSFRSRKPR